MKLSIAENYAQRLCSWIQPYCGAVNIAGSIRRGRPECGDVDIVCVPNMTETRDLFGAVTESKNLLHSFLKDYVAGDSRARFQAGGDVAGKMVILQLSKCQLDLWFATPETFATRLMCRTGSKEHNIWLASRALRMGLKWNPYEGIVQGEETNRYSSEAMLYDALGLPFIEPKNRELDWLVKNFGA